MTVNSICYQGRKITILEAVILKIAFCFNWGKCQLASISVLLLFPRLQVLIFLRGRISIIHVLFSFMQDSGM